MITHSTMKGRTREKGLRVRESKVRERAAS
jgi:hypothetical protein